MIKSKRFFGKRLKRALLSANKAIYGSRFNKNAVECDQCGGSGLDSDQLMETCTSCNGAGIVSRGVFAEVRRSLSITRHSYREQMTEDFETLAFKINKRYSRVASHYRNW